MIKSEVFIFLYIFLISSSITKETDSKCMSAAKNCVDRRIKRGGGGRDIRTVFQDALFHYCLDLTGCEAGKQQICHSVGKSEREYSEPNLRRRLIRQCGIWKIPVRNPKAGEALGHYQYLRDSKH